MGVEKKKTKLDENDKNAKLDDGYIALPNYKDIVPSVFLNIGDTKPTACVLKVLFYLLIHSFLACNYF